MKIRQIDIRARELLPNSNILEFNQHPFPVLNMRKNGYKYNAWRITHLSLLTFVHKGGDGRMLTEVINTSFKL